MCFLLSVYRNPKRVTWFGNPLSPIHKGGLGLEQRGKDSQIWVSRDGIAQMDSLEVGEASGNRTLTWPKLGIVFQNVQTCSKVT